MYVELASCLMYAHHTRIHDVRTSDTTCLMYAHHTRQKSPYEDDSTTFPLVGVELVFKQKFNVRTSHSSNQPHLKEPHARKNALHALHDGQWHIMSVGRGKGCVVSEFRTPLMSEGPYIHFQEPFINAKGSYTPLMSEGPYIHFQEPFINAKGSYTKDKGPHMRWLRLIGSLKL